MEVFQQPAPSQKDIDIFVGQVNFRLPEGFLSFLKTSDGAEIEGDDEYALLWPLTQLFSLNSSYEVEEFASDFFFFGSNGGDTAYAIQRSSGSIYSLPFIGMSNSSASYFCNDFNDFLRKIK